MMRDPLEVMAEIYSWEDMGRLLINWTRTYQYRWRGGHAVFPFSIEETRARQRITEGAYTFLAIRYSAERRSNEV